ncbi:MAG TPA: 2-phospho-L-lactate guanylyltransferase [Solirubrobacteraceae bacterium]|jgi:2-phospho-L-lactate guanylyltransferase|nr:2-phospho-L-lactate guanylyltransferase [Solirubrobacteraceae bacterium]
MRTVAILPVKRLELAKQRLGSTLPEPARQQLARAMTTDVLIALRGTPALDAVAVVTADVQVRALAAAHGAEVVTDTRSDGQSAAAQLGLDWAMAGGAQRAVLVPGDCPALDPAELTSLLAGPPEVPSVVIVPDRHGTGTNALVLCPPTVIVPGFGPDSFARHQRAAQAARVATRVARPPSLLLDVDTGADLGALRRALAGLDPRTAAHTRRQLADASVSVLPVS